MYNIYLLMVVLMLMYWLFSKLEEKKKLTTWVRILVVVFGMGIRLFVDSLLS